MQVLISSLLQFSRVQTRGAPLVPTAVTRAVEEAVANLQAAIDESQATIDCHDLPTVAADHNQLVRLFQNLISNGLKFRREQSPCVEISAEQVGDGAGRRRSRH